MAQLHIPGVSCRASVVSAYCVRPVRVELPGSAIFRCIAGPASQICRISLFVMKSAQPSRCEKRLVVVTGGRLPSATDSAHGEGRSVLGVG